MTAKSPMQSTRRREVRIVLKGVGTKVGRLGAVGLLITSGTLLVEGIESQSAQASASFVNDYPDGAQPCEHPNSMGVYATTGACNNYDWGPTHTTVLSDPSTLSTRGYAFRNCTDGVAWWVSHNLPGHTVPGGWGSAISWDNSAPSSEVLAGNSNSIEPGDIAQSDGGSFGHVGFVTSVAKDSSGHVASFSTAELNAAGTGNESEPTYSAKNSSGYFIRTGTSYTWDHFIDVNGIGKGLNNEDLAGGSGTGSTGPTFTPSVIQRPSGETDVAVVGPGNSLAFYYNAAGSSSWGGGVISGSQAYSTPKIVQRPSGETDNVYVDNR